MNDLPPEGANIQAVMLDAVCEALTAAFIVYDRNDHILFASRNVGIYFPGSGGFLTPGTRLRDFLGAIYDNGNHLSSATLPLRGNISRDEWITERIASHWKERSDIVERQGADRWIQFSKRRLPSGYGVCLVRDVTETKKREEQWRADLERVQVTEEILDSLPFPVFVTDRNMILVAVNKSVCGLLAKPADAILGKPVADLYPREISHRVEAADRHVLETGERFNQPEELLLADGLHHVMITRKQRVGKPGRYFIVTTMEDVSGFVQSDVGTDISSLPMEDAFISASMSRDAALEGLSIDPQVVERLNGHKVLLVTADIAIEARALKTMTRLGVECCCVHSESEQEAFIDIAQASGVKIDLVVIDTQMSLKCLELAERRGIDVLALDGFQLSGELAATLLAHVGRKPEYPPMAEDRDDWEISTLQSVTDHATASLDVLVAEDNDINQIVFSQILEGLGYSYAIATDGEEAVHIWQMRRPKIILMDVTLPVMNGFDACRKIRAFEALHGGSTPVIGVLAQAFDRDRLECGEAGMNDVILKPISPDMIESLFFQFMPQARVAQAR